MEQNTNQSSTPLFSVAEIIGIILKKIKVIVCISLILAILVSAGSTWLKSKEITYGNTVDFYITDVDNTEALLPLLQSESFVEMLLLDEYGLPENLANTGNQNYETAKKAVIASEEAREKLLAARIELRRINLNLTTPIDPKTGETISSFTVIDQEYNNLINEYNVIYNLLSTYKAAVAEATVTEQHQKQIEKLEINLDAAREKKDSYRESAYNPAIREKTAMQDKYTRICREYDDLRKEANTLVEQVLVEWRNSEDVQRKVSAISESLTFAYATPAQSIEEALENDKNNSSDEEDKNKILFLKVDVSVQGDEELAEFVLVRIKARLPEFAERNVDNLSSSITPKCVVISPFSHANCLNFNDTVKDVAVAGVLCFALSVIIICLIIIGLEALKRMNVIASNKLPTDNSVQ